MVKASVPTPIVMELYADSTADGVPLGRSFGNVTISFSDNVANIVYNVADPVWFVFTESDFYMGESHIPTNASISESSHINLQLFPFHKEYETAQVPYESVISSYDFYIAGHAR